MTPKASMTPTDQEVSMLFQSNYPENSRSKAINWKQRRSDNDDSSGSPSLTPAINCSTSLSPALGHRSSVIQPASWIPRAAATVAHLIAHGGKIDNEKAEEEETKKKSSFCSLDITARLHEKSARIPAELRARGKKKGSSRSFTAIVYPNCSRGGVVWIGLIGAISWCVGALSRSKFLMAILLMLIRALAALLNDTCDCEINNYNPLLDYNYLRVRGRTGKI